MNLADGSID